MKAIILAAGEGSRLRPYTEDIPKCMVKFQGESIIDYTLKNMVDSDLKDIVVITGYKEDKLKKHLCQNYSSQDIKTYSNLNFDRTNMVNTLFCAEDELNDDVIISYSDIVYRKEILDKLINSKEDITVIIDKDWKKLWKCRMDNPLDDAETLKLDDKGDILEIGKEAKDYKDIEGQYIGLIKISKNKISEVVRFYHSLSKDKLYDGKDFENMYMTSFIQLLIDNGFKVSPLPISGGWVEVDTTEDLERLKDYKM